MSRHELESRIKASYQNIAPDILGSVLSDCDTQKGRIIVMQEKTKKRSLAKYIAGMAAALLLVIGGVGGMSLYRGNRAIAATIMLDVNPSIEIQVNKNEKVLAVTPLNEEAEIIVGNMDFSGSGLDVTVNALIGSMLRNGYISNAANSILVSIDNSDSAAGHDMQSRLMSEINAILESGNVSGAVLGQTVTNNSEIKQLADQYGMTVGKAELIKQITRQNPLYTFADLAPLTINELNLIFASGAAKLESIESIGTASASSYIGAQAAKKAAFGHAGVSAEKVTEVKCELDLEHGVMVYEVDFDAEGFEYEYDINAKTGAIVKAEKEVSDDETPGHSHSHHSGESSTSESKPGETSPAETSPETSPAAPAYIGEAAAKAAALKHAGVSGSDIREYACELDREHGTAVYEIEFKAGAYEYDYDINALTGAVVKHSKEADDDCAEQTKPAPAPPAETTPAAPAYIGEAAAKAAALKHAGVSGNDIREYACELDREHGTAVYEIEFKAGGYEYDYDINALTGAVVKHSKEADDDYTEQTKPAPAPPAETTPAAPTYIGEAAAKAAALKHAGVSGNDIREYGCELDREHGTAVYEIEFKAGGYEYEYEIDAASGAVLKSEKERD